MSSLFQSAASTEINTNSLEFPPFFHILAFISLSPSGKLNALAVKKTLLYMKFWGHIYLAILKNPYLAALQF